MWNVNICRGAIWYVKSINEHDEQYIGMTAGSSLVLINNAFKDELGNNKFTYFKIAFSKPNFNNYKEISFPDRTVYVILDNIYTGEQLALERFVKKLTDEILRDIMIECKNYFNFDLRKEPRSKSLKEATLDVCQQRIYKFGIYVYVTENEHVSVSSTGKINLSKEAREDIIYNSQTEQDLLKLSEKYCIYPVKAIKEIKNRLVYQHKQLKG